MRMLTGYSSELELANEKGSMAGSMGAVSGGAVLGPAWGRGALGPPRGLRENGCARGWG